MAYLDGLPPLPKSLAGLLNMHPQQTIPTGRRSTQSTRLDRQIESILDSRPESARSDHSVMATFEPYYVNGATLFSPRQSSNHSPKHSSASSKYSDRTSPPFRNQQACKSSSNLDSQLAVLRKEMVGLRQLDLSLVCQLWSLNESIEELKQMVSEPSKGQGERSPDDTDDYYGIPVRRPNPYLGYTRTLSPSSSESSLA